MLGNNVNNQQQNMQFQSVNPKLAQEQQVPMQAINPELLKDNIQDTYVANRFSETAEDPKAVLYQAAIAIPAWLAISQGMDYYSNASRGDFANTVHGKMGRFGDKISDNIKNSSFGKSSFAKSLNKNFDKFKKFFTKHIVESNRVTRAIAHTPSTPELDMVKGQANGGIGFIGFDCQQHDDAFVKPLKKLDDLKCYGAEKADIDKYKKLLTKLNPKAEQQLLQTAEFECLTKYSRAGGKTGAALEADIKAFQKLKPEQRALKLRDMKAFEWGYNDFAEMEKVHKNMQEHLPRVFEAAKNANKKMYAFIYGTEATAAGKTVHKLFGRKVYASETANKLAAFLGNMNLSRNPEWARVLKSTGYDKVLPKSKLGKFFTKYANLITEGATNRVAGGKLVAIAQAIYLADVIYKSMKADGLSEKAKSFAERFTEMISFFVCMPMAIQLMHRAGGMQYAGMTPEQVAKYRRHLEAHNTKAMSGGFKTKAEWKASEKALKTELNAGVKNPFVKLCKRIGRIITVGLEQIRPWDKKDIGIMKDGKKVYRKGLTAKLKDLLHHPKFGIKQMAGYPMRIIIGMMVLLPFLSKIAVKGCHLIFGKPKNSILDEEKEQREDLTSQVAQNNIPAQTPQQQAQERANLLDKYKQAPAQKTESEQNLNKDDNEPKRTYIPSPIGVQITQGEDVSAADAALKRADEVEKMVMQTLKMN